MTKMILGLSGLALLGLAACDRSEPQPPPSAPVRIPSSPAAIDPVLPTPVVVYNCADGQTLAARYPDSSTAVIDYAGKTYTLKTAVSASGARYVGEGWQWWTKGMNDGQLAALKPGETIATSDSIACAVGAAPPQPPVPAAPPPAVNPPLNPPLNPPGPGQVGGLPDDRTPIAEGPIDPKSAQGAASVLQSYYALIEAKKYRQAYALWQGRNPKSEAAFIKQFDVFSEYHANIGAPGDAEGAAGSSYVTVPVQIYGREKSGKAFNLRGEATLRRVNDVDGSTAAQRRWHIEKIDAKPMGKI